MSSVCTELLSGLDLLNLQGNPPAGGEYKLSGSGSLLDRTGLLTKSATALPALMLETQVMSKTSGRIWGWIINWK